MHRYFNEQLNQDATKSDIKRRLQSGVATCDALTLATHAICVHLGLSLDLSVDSQTTTTDLTT